MAESIANLLVVESSPGQEADLEERLAAFVLECRQAEGCLSYDCFQSLEASHRFMLQIRWRDRESLNQHLESEELRRFLTAIPELQTESFLEAYRNFIPES